MKTIVWCLCAWICVWMSSCGVKYRVYGIKEYSDYDTLRGVFVRKDKKDENARLVVSPEEYILYSPERKMLLKRMSAQTDYDDAMYSYVLYMGRRYRMVEYADEGYYGENKKTYLLYDVGKRYPMMMFSVDAGEEYGRAKERDLAGVTQDTAIVSQRNIKPEKGTRIKPERQYLLQRGFDF